MKKRLFTDLNIKRIGDFVDHHYSKTKNLDGDIPPFSSIEISLNGSCNRRCHFCPRVDEKEYPNIPTSLDLRVFKKLVDDLTKINYSGRFSFTGFSEPLLTKNLYQYISYSKEKLNDSVVEIVTNGDVLVSKNGQRILNELFQSGLDNCRVSLYDGPHQVKIFKKIQSDLNLSDKQFIIRERFLGPDQSFGLTISNRAGSVKLKTDHFVVEPLKEPLKQPCYYPFYKVLIDYDGTVLMCSNDWKKEKPMGNIKDESLLSIWSNNLFNSQRQKLCNSDRSENPCNVCDVNGTLNGEVAFNRWQNYFRKND